MAIQPPIVGEPLRASWAMQLTDTVNALSPMGASGMLARQGFGGNGSAPLPENKRGIFSAAIDMTFMVRHVVKNDTQGGNVPYTGWEIYMPEGAVAVGATCKPINPAAYRTNNGTDSFLSGWFRLPCPADEPSALTSWAVVVHAKCSAALTGIDSFSDWPKKYVWAEIRKSVRTHAEEEADANDVGDTFAATVGIIIWSVAETGDDPTPSYTRTVSSPIFVRDNSQYDPFSLLMAFSVDADDVELVFERLFVRNQAFSAAGATYMSNDMTEIDVEDEAVYIKISTQTNPYTAEIVSYHSLEVDDDVISVPAQAKNDAANGEIMLNLYSLKNGHVTSDNRSSLQNIQLYR